jgi:4'-phosphopantetheinyl transferase
MSYVSLAGQIPLRLNPSEIHVWNAGLDFAAGRLARCWLLLAPNEKERAERFHFPIHRNRYTAGRALLRQLLGCYAGLPPEQVVLHEGPRGKPMLDKGIGEDIQFNLSHSQDRLLVAVTRDCEVGADLEWVRPIADLEALAHLVMSAAEWQDFKDVPQPDRTAVFYCLWTRKEALLKALGAGFSIDPRSLHVGSAGQQAGAWRIYEASAPSGYCGAVAVCNPAARFIEWECGEEIMDEVDGASAAGRIASWSSLRMPAH